MAMEGPAAVVLDTSVLINFLAIDRTDLFGALRRLRFIITEHARAEITDYYPTQLARLQAALEASDSILENPVGQLTRGWQASSGVASATLGWPDGQRQERGRRSSEARRLIRAGTRAKL